jgi:hypothetical protein
LRRFEQPQARREIGTDEFRHELGSRAARVSPMRDPAECDDIARQRHARPSAQSEQLAQPCARADRPDRHPPRAPVTPGRAEAIEKLLNRDRPIVSDVIDAADVVTTDRGRGGPQVVGHGDQRTPSPYTTPSRRITGIVDVPRVRDISKRSASSRVRACTEIGSRSSRPVAGLSIVVGPSTCGNEARTTFRTRVASAVSTRLVRQVPRQKCSHVAGRPRNEDRPAAQDGGSQASLPV